MLIESIDGPLVSNVRRRALIAAEPDQQPSPERFHALLNNTPNQPPARPRDDISPASQSREIARRDLQQDTDGRIDYTVIPNDNLWNIGDRYDRSIEEIKAANRQFFPPASNPNVIQPGQIVTILNDDRTRIAVEMAEATDPARIRDLITQDLQYATKDTPTPGDQLTDAQNDLLPRRPGDADFARIVEEQGNTLTNQWDAEGRTHQVWDPILEAAGRSDWQGVGDIVKQQLNTVSQTSPTLEAIATRRDMLLAYGPGDQAFGDAVNQTYQRYVVDEPAAAAQQVADAYQQGGALAASETLRNLTNPETTNPLQAALIAQAARPTVSNIASDFIDPTQSLWHDEPGVGVVGDYQGIYKNLGAIAERINLSPEGEDVIDFMADTLQAHGAQNISARSAAGEGSLILSQEISDRLRAQGDTERADQITNESKLVAGDFLPGLGVYVDEDTYLRSPTYELDEPGKVSEILLENGGTMSVYVGSGVDFWQRTTDFGPTRSPSEVLARGPSSGRRAGGSTAEHDPLYNVGLRIPIEPRGAVKKLAKDITEDLDSAANSKKGSDSGLGFEASPAVTVGARTYEQGKENGLQLQAFLTPEIEKELPLGEIDDVFGKTLVNAFPHLLRQAGAIVPLGEAGQSDLQNNDLDQVLTTARVAGILESYVSKNPQIDMSTRLGLNPTLTVDYFVEGDPLFDENVSSWLQERGEQLSGAATAEDYLFQPVPPLPGIPPLIGPSFEGPRIAGEVLSAAGEIAEGVPEINSESRQELAVTIGASGYLFFSEKTAERGIPKPPLTASLLNSSIGVTASASIQFVYEPPVQLSTAEIADIRNQAPVPFQRGSDGENFTN